MVLQQLQCQCFETELVSLLSEPHTNFDLPALIFFSNFDLPGLGGVAYTRAFAGMYFSP